MVKIPRGVVELHEYLERRIHLASLQYDVNEQELKKIPICRLPDGNLTNWAEACASGGYLNLIGVRDKLYEIYPQLKNESQTLEEHQVIYF